MHPTLSRKLALLGATLVLALPAWGEGQESVEADSSGAKAVAYQAKPADQRVYVVHVNSVPVTEEATAAAREAGLPIIGPTQSAFEHLQAKPASRWGLYKPAKRKSRSLERFPGID
jgi:hypothetical protein